MADPGSGDSDGHSGSKKSRHTCDVGIQVGPKLGKSGRFRNYALFSLWTLAVVVAVVATMPMWGNTVAFIESMLFPNDFVVGPELMEDLGMEGVVTFKQHDRDGDGMLSIEEFEPIAHRLFQLNDTTNYDMPIKEWDEVVTVQSFFIPLDIQTMSKAKDQYSLMPSPGSLDSLHGLKYWKKAVLEWKNFAAEHLRPFLPDDPYVLEGVGEVYYLVEPLEGVKNGPSLSSNRYRPPLLSGDREIMIHRLLAMFHPKPFVHMRFAPQGSVAIIRASNEKYVDISFRIHAEFQLNEPPFYPYWFTPAQFTGNIVISKDGTRVISFHLFVPAERKLNVDMEWQNGPKDQENMEVDIGKMDQMELKSTRSSVPAFEDGVDHTNTFIPEQVDEKKELVWQKEISLQKALRELEVKMFPFKEVAYHNFTEAFHHARQDGKPIHSILLWGALDDQSC